MTNTERVAYIRGLMEGLNLDENKDEVKVLNAMLDLLDEMASDLAGLDETVDEVAGQVDEIDEDLAALEDEIYGEEEDDEDDEDDECYYEVTCPNCNETICLSESIIEDGKMECPNCGELLEFEVEEEEDGCGCGCGHSEDGE